MRLDDFSTVTRARTLPEPTHDGDVVSAIALRLLDEYAPPRPVRLLGVRVAGLLAADATREGAVSALAGDAGAPDGQLGLPV